MSLEQLESSILSLAPEERKQFAQWFEEHRHHLIQGATAADDELTAEQHTEILRRREQALAHPELLEPWDGTIDRVRQRLHEIRRQKTSSR